MRSRTSGRSQSSLQLGASSAESTHAGWGPAERRGPRAPTEKERRKGLSSSFTEQ